MDNSQSSDIFFDESINVSNGSQMISDQMDHPLYEDSISKLKYALGNEYRKQLKKPTFDDYISMLLEDCGHCVSQTLDLIINALSEPNVQVEKLVQYLVNAVSILQMLSNCIKTVVETVSMLCCKIQNFPTSTGHILMIVFMHCKESEELYGITLKSVESQLKDLFRACHELQLTYLNVMEKSFIFDLTEREQLLVLNNALDINLKIGELVQTLDVKTMAEQWKALIGIYEKYSQALMEKNIYNDCTLVLCSMIEDNLKNALQPNQDEKTVLRSLKVTGFTLKILVKVSTIFRHASKKNQQRLVDLNLFVHTHYSALGVNFEKHSNVTNTYVLNPLDVLLRELVLDEKFNDTILNYDRHIILAENKITGFITFFINVMKIIVTHNDAKISKKRIVDCVYDFLPYVERSNEMSFFEALLSHTTAIAMTMSCEEFTALERHMIEGILSTECFIALFSLNLWSLLARMMPRQLLYNQTALLCEMYQKLESNQLFLRSPQKVHLTHTIRNLFEVMHNEDKIRFYKEYSVQSDRNISLWAVLSISNLPVIIRSKVEDFVLDKLLQIEKCIENKEVVDINTMIGAMNLASTCSIKNDRRKTEFISKQWERVCPKNFILQNVNSSMWYLQYLEALIIMTSSEDYLNQNILEKIFHAISGLIETNIEEIQILLIDFVYKLAIEFPDSYSENIIEIFRELLKDSMNTVASVTLHKLKYTTERSRNIDRIITEIVNQNSCLEDMFKKIGNKNYESIELSNDISFRHKCIQNHVTLDKIEAVNKCGSGNFDFADIDTLFENESESEPQSEPACKKPKLNVNEADVIISRLENDVSVLCNIKENIFTLQQKDKINNLCDKLRNIIDC